MAILTFFMWFMALVFALPFGWKIFMFMMFAGSVYAIVALFLANIAMKGL
jgi:hypothetical protein